MNANSLLGNGNGTEAGANNDHLAFTEFLSRAAPMRLIATDISDFIQRESNKRLQTAREEGILLDDMYIGQDCLPTWIGMHWDPFKEALHCAVQDRLLDLAIPNLLGDIIREMLVDRGNRKLEEARQLGITLENITIGSDLLAAWGPPLEHDRLLGASLEEQPGEPQTNDDMGQSSLETAVLRSPLFSISPSDESDTISISAEDEVASSLGDAHESSSTYDGCSDSSSDDSSSDEDDESFDDVIRINNALDPQPEYWESDDDAPHVLHDVEIVGGPDGYSDVDLEVYEAEDDEDAEYLPEIELAIDGDSFISFFGDEGAVDVEIPRMDLRCSLETIPRDDGEEADFFAQGQFSENDEEDDGNLVEDQGEHPDSTDEDDA